MENLGIDLKLIVAQIISISAFFFIFRKFISSPLMKYLNEQKEGEELREKMSSELEKRNAVIEEKDKKMNQERKEALEVALIQGKKEADQVKKGLIEDAKIQAGSVIARAKEQIEEERTTMYKNIRKKVAQLSVVLVEQALKDYLSVDAQKEITKNITQKIPKIKIEE